MNRKPPHARWSIRIPLALLLVFAAWAALGAMGGRKAPAFLVRRMTLVQKVVANGRVYVPARIQLGTPVGGNVTQVCVREGEHVSKAQLLLALDDRDARAGIEQARARLQQVREVDIRTTEEDLRSAEASFRRAERQFQRVQALFDSQTVARQDLDGAREEFELAQSRRASADARVQSKKPGGSDALLAEASLASAEAKLANTKIFAPGPGTILSRKVERGDVVQPGQVLLVLARDTLSILSVQPEEKSLAFLHPDQMAQASADAYPGQSFAAKIIEIAPVIDAQRGTVEVKLLVIAPPDYLKPDMTVSINIEVAKKENALVLPSEAVRDPDSPSPWVLVVRGHHAERLALRIGIRGEGSVEILGGLEEGDRVILPSAGRIADGDRVRPVLLEK